MQKSLLPSFPKMPKYWLEIAIHHREAVEDACVDPEAYFGEDAPKNYATDAEEQIKDFLDRMQTYANSVGDHRYEKAANDALQCIMKAWNR